MRDRKIRMETPFRIVIDSFDGKLIHAWHVETEDKEKSKSLITWPFAPGNKYDVLVGVNGTTEGFLRLSMLPRLGFMEYCAGQCPRSGR